MLVPLARDGLGIPLDGQPASLLGLEGRTGTLSGEEVKREDCEGLSTNDLFTESLNPGVCFCIATFLKPNEDSGVPGSDGWRTLLFVSCQDLAGTLMTLEVSGICLHAVSSGVPEMLSDETLSISVDAEISFRSNDALLEPSSSNIDCRSDRTVARMSVFPAEHSRVFVGRFDCRLLAAGHR